MQNKITNFLTQWKISIPLAVVVLVWFFWPQAFPSKVIKSINSTTVSLPKEEGVQKVAISSLFGAKKRLRCSIESATAVVDDTKVAATLTADKKMTRVVFDGDCLYRWTNGSSGGERSCGLKSYLPYVSQFVNNDSLQKLFPESNELMTSCKDIPVVDSKVFEVPKNVLFKNKKLF